MKTGRLWLPVILGINLIAACCAFAAVTISGTLRLSTAKAGLIMLDTDSGTQSYKPAKNIKVVRGQVGLNLREADLKDLAPGDRVVVIVDSNGDIASLKAYFGLVKGTLSAIKDNKLQLKDGRYVQINSEAVVVLEDGTLGHIKDLKSGALITCRVNPNTSEAWTILVSAPSQVSKLSIKAQDKLPDPDKQARVLTEPKPTPVMSADKHPKEKNKAVVPIVKPEIKSLTYSAPANLKPGDLITVDMSGTPEAKATFEVKQLIALTKMTEISPGSYRAVVTVPKNKHAEDVPLLGHLSLNGTKSLTMQASRLVSVLPVKSASAAISLHPGVEVIPAKLPVASSGQEKKVDTASTQTNTVKDPQPKAQVVIAQPKVEIKQKTINNIVLTNPPAGALIERALLVRGTAESDAKVQVIITYTNNLSGILKLAGQVTSQAIAIGKNGEFRFGPIALEGPLATKGLEFTIKAFYPDNSDHGTATVKVYGSRN